MNYEDVMDSRDLEEKLQEIKIEVDEMEANFCCEDWIKENLSEDDQKLLKADLQEFKTEYFNMHICDYDEFVAIQQLKEEMDIDEWLSGIIFVSDDYWNTYAEDEFNDTILCDVSQDAMFFAAKYIDYDSYSEDLQDAYQECDFMNYVVYARV